MTQVETSQIKRLFKLAHVTQEFEMVNLKLVDHFNSLREEHGLMRLLLLIKEYVESTHVRTLIESKITAPSHETQDTNQDSTVVP